LDSFQGELSTRGILNSITSPDCGYLFSD
jgi:hypothetical protein